MMLRWKVYLGDECLASFKRPEHAAVLVAVLGPGSTIRLNNNRILWLEGEEMFPAGDSCDEVARVCEERRHHHVAWTWLSAYRQPRPPKSHR